MQDSLKLLSLSELSSLVVPLLAQHACPVCGAKDLAHDESLCAQTSYAAFDGYRAQELAAGRWDGLEVVNPLEVEPVKPVKREKKRCGHYQAIREFFAVAREKGLDTKAQERARGAIGVVIGRRIESRADMTADEWIEATYALRLGFLTW